MEGLKTQLVIHKRTLVRTTGILIIYSLIGFLLVPWFVNRQVSNILADRLALTTTIESIYFNPFSFYFELTGLTVTDNGASLLSLSHFHGNLQISRLFLLKAQLAEITIEGAGLNFLRSTETDNTLTLLAQRWNDSSENSIEPNTTEPSTESELPPVEVLRLELSDIRLNLVDSSLATEFTTSLKLEQLLVESFSTLEDGLGQSKFELVFEDNGRLSQNGEFTVNPARLNGSVTMADFSLAALSRYGQDNLPASVQSGVVQWEFNYEIDLSSDTVAASINNLVIQFQSLVLIEDDTSIPFLELGAISLTNGELQIPENVFYADSLEVDNLSLSAQTDELKELNLVRMLNTFSDNQPEPIAASPDTSNSSSEQPWQVSLDSFTVQNNRLSYTDNSLELPFALSSNLNGSISNISNQADARFPLDLTLTLNSGGNLSLQGDAQAIPQPGILAALQIQSLNLTVVQPYLNEFAFIELGNGTLDVTSELTVDASEPLSINGSVALQDLTASDSQLNETLLAAEELAIDALNLSLASNSLEISEVLLESPFARIVVNEDGSTNLGRTLKPVQTTESVGNPEPETLESEQPEQTTPLVITVGQIRVNDGSANFTDKDLPIVFNANIQQLSGLAEGFATNSSQATRVAMEGQVDEFGLVQVNGNLRPFAVTEQSLIDVDFTNIDMPTMTPYVIKFAGREIDDGSVDLNLHYEITNGELDANNQLVLNKLILGERVEHPDAMDLPLDLALALLKDSNGVIDLEVPISGDVNDPEFDFGPAIRRAITNVFTNIVAAPFRLLGNLVGSEDSSLESIRFLPGRIDIAAPEREVLLQLGNALQQRPDLMLEIPAITVLEDELALKTARVNEKVDEALRALEPGDQLLTERRRQVLENFYIASDPSDLLTDIQQLHSTVVIEAADETDSLTLDVIAYNADLLVRLVDRERLDASALENLARARANEVVTFLRDNTGFSANRVKVTDLITGEIDDEGWITMEFGLGTDS